MEFFGEKMPTSNTKNGNIWLLLRGKSQNNCTFHNIEWDEKKSIGKGILTMQELCGKSP